MKKILLILCALMLTAVGASAQTIVHECEAEFNDWSISGNSGGTFQRNTWSTEADGSGLRTPFIEYWVGSGSVLPDATISHKQLTGLETGYYEVSIVARAFNENSTTAVSKGITFTANDESVDLTEGTEDVYDSSSEEVYYTYNLLVYVEEGTLDIGFTIQGLTACDWMAFKNLEVTYLGDSPVGYVAHECEAMLGHWTIEQSGSNGDFHLNTWSTEADASGMAVPFLEYWVYGTTLSTATISHETITGLTAGYYEVSLDIRIFSEAGNEIGSGTTFNANGVSEDLDTGSDGHEGTYGTETEVYGTYTLICEVGEDGLDISITIPSGVAYNWIAFKNLSVTYLGEELSYTIGNPQCSANYVQPGSEVSITFPNCISPTEGETPTLSSTAKITVNSTEVTGTLSYSGTTATVTFTMPSTIGYGETVTVAVPAGLLSWNSTSVSSAAGEFTLHTTAIADQQGVYLYSTHADGFLSRGGEHLASENTESYGKIATTDPYGIPVDITFGNDGFATVKFLDSNLFLYAGGWAWTDGSEAAAAKYTINEVTVEGETVYQFCYDGGDDSFLYVNDEYWDWVANNGNFNGDNNLQNDITRTYWQIFSMAERDAYKEAFVASQKAAIAEAVGATDLDTYIASLSQTDVTDMVTSAALAGSLSGWTETDYYTDNGSTYFTTGDWGTEIYQGDARLLQTVSGLAEGVYKVTLQGFVRQGWADNIISSGLDNYDLSIGFLEANGYQINLQAWATEANLTSQLPNSTSDAFTDGRTYANELYTYVGEDGTLELSINCPDILSGGWMIFKNLTLTQYVGTTISWDMTDAGWGTMIIPFDADVPEGLTLYAGDELDEDNTTATIVVGTAATSIVANTPYLVSGTEGTYSFTGVATNTADTYTVGLLTGTYVNLGYDDFVSAEGDGSTVYLLQNHTDDGEGVAFYPVTSESTGATLTPYHCYLDFNGPAGEPGDEGEPTKLSIVLPGTGETTGIQAVESDLIANDAIYDLSGRRVAKAVKGVYIMNGKKVLVK